MLYIVLFLVILSISIYGVIHGRAIGYGLMILIGINSVAYLISKLKERRKAE
jgi:hypothetical protein